MRPRKENMICGMFHYAESCDNFFDLSEHMAVNRKYGQVGSGTITVKDCDDSSTKDLS